MCGQPHDSKGTENRGVGGRSRIEAVLRNANAAKLHLCSPTTRCASKTLTDAAIPSRNILTATIFSATVIGWFMLALFAGWKRKHRFSRGVIPTTSATG